VPISAPLRPGPSGSGGTVPLRQDEPGPGRAVIHTSHETDIETGYRT
jgi:hypothetical protein